MSERKIVAPEGMLIAAMDAAQAHFNGERKNVRLAVEAALRWLVENPIVPTHKQWCELTSQVPGGNSWEACAEWQRRMFLAPQPDAIEDLMWKPKSHGTELDRQLSRYDEAHDADVREAYRRGQKAGTNAGK